MTLFLILLSIKKNPSFAQVIEFFQLWPAFQWFTSLLTLVLIYWASGRFYNKYLSTHGGWMDTKTRVYMILVDLFLNFAFGIYYMNHRDTFIGALTIKCPVFCSPLFWIVELICFYAYSRYLKKHLSTSTNVTSNKVKREKKC